MAGSVSLTGSDVITIDGRIIRDFSGDKPAELSFPNDLAAAKISKNGNIVYAFNNVGNLADLELHVLLGSADDKYLNSRLQEMKNDFSSFILFNGVFSKIVGDGAGNTQAKVYQCSGGIVKRQPMVKTSASGDTEQSEAIYNFLFRLDAITNQ